MKKKKRRPHPAEDLFGEIPVTWDEVRQWVREVAGLDPDSWRAAWYVRCWNVPEKIRQVKRADQSNS